VTEAVALAAPAPAAPQAPTATSAPTEQAEAQPAPVAITLPADLAQAILKRITSGGKPILT